jgi:iron complex outermembrane receptor protein
MRITSRPLLLSIMLGVTPQYVLSDEFEGDFFSELPVITSASRLTQSVLSSPSAVTVIDSAMIRASGFIDVADIFRLVPGFQVSHADGGTHAVINHGDGWEYPNRMQLLIDGRSTYTNAISAIDWNTLGIQIEDIERIEVVRGPAASAYGANSFAGAINVITKAPELDNEWELGARYGNEGERRLLLRHSGEYKKLNYRLSAATRDHDGYDNYLDSRDFHDVALTGRYQHNASNNFFTHFSATSGDAGMPPIIESSPDFFNDRKRDTEAISAHLRWDHIISDSQELKVNFYHNFREEDDMTFSRVPLYDLIEITEDKYFDDGLDSFFGDPEQRVEVGERTYKSHRSDLELQYSEILDSGLQYVMGLGSRYDSMESEAFFPEKGTVSNTSFRAFANVQVPLSEKFTANAGGFYEVNRTDEPHFSPRLSLTWHISDYQSLRAGYSIAYRIPSLLEEHMDLGVYSETGELVDQIYLADSGIEAERVKALDIGYVGKMRNLPLSWEVRAYKEEYDNVIDFYIDNDPGAVDTNDELTRLGNVTQSQMYGFEGSILYRPQKDSFIRFHFNRGHETGTYIKEINEPDPPFTDIESLHSGAPRKSYGILAAKTVDDWQFNVGLYHVGTMQWFDRGDKVDSYTRVDASVIKRVPLAGKQELVFKLGGQNIGNEKYSEFQQDDDDNFLLEFQPRYYFSVTYLNF